MIELIPRARSALCYAAVIALLRDAAGDALYDEDVSMYDDRTVRGR